MLLFRFAMIPSSPFSFASTKISFPWVSMYHLDAVHRRDDLLQPVTALQNSLAGEIPTVTPKHVEHIKGPPAQLAASTIVRATVSRGMPSGSG
jgi:hypothetical protein